MGTGSSTYIILIDWSSGGHNASYVNSYREAWEYLGYKVDIIVSRTLAHQLSRASKGSVENVSPVSDVEGVDWPSFLPIRPLSLQRTFRRRSFAYLIANRIRVVAKRRGSPPAFLFFTTVHETDFDLLCEVNRRASLPWSFLYLHPYLFTGNDQNRYVSDKLAKQVFSSETLLGIATLNEDMVDAITSFSGKPTFAFPDITDHRSALDHPLERRLRRFADGRFLIVLAGHLTPWKGAALLAEVCLNTDPERFAFLFAGEIPWDAYSNEDKSTIERCMNETPHAMFHLGRIPDGPSYNALFQAADVIVSVYDNWPFSSNTLTKAAIFRKLVIVNEQGLPATRVRDYRLGLEIKFSTDALRRAIESLENTKDSEELCSNALWDEYLKKHGSEQLPLALKDLLHCGKRGETAATN